MYEYLNGRLVEKTPLAAVIDIGGVGYHVRIPLSTFSALPELGQPVRLWTHFVVREDVQQIYGFLTQEERSLFQLLISISGIGPKSAATVLSGLAPADLKRAIVDGNLALLTGIPGIGRKTAERIVIELREKIVVEEHASGTFSAGAKGGGDRQVMEDSLSALLELGYRKQNAQEAVKKAMKNFEGDRYSVSDLVRASLKCIA